jgi:hypothetical protein
MPKQQYLFVSYARLDADRVLPLVEAVQKELEFRALPIRVWLDLSELQPGENWNSAISEALESSIGVLLFVSQASLGSEWMCRDLQVATTTRNRLLIPVFLQRHFEAVPNPLKHLKGIAFPGRATNKQTIVAAAEVADGVEGYLNSTRAPSPVVAKAEIPVIAADLARELRSPGVAMESGEPPKSVFVVHGHSEKGLAELELFLTSVGVEPEVLSRRGESAQSLFQKFMVVAAKAQFAVVLLSSDDFGVSRRQYDSRGVGVRALQFRARQFPCR